MAEKKPNIALVDDDPKILELTAKYLRDQNLNVFTADSGSALDTIVETSSIDLIVLDLMMPEESGLNLCQRYRAKNINLPIIMLTAKGDEVDRIVGLKWVQMTILQNLLALESCSLELMRLLEDRPH